MNRLDLAKMVRAEAGISGSENTVVSPTGEWALILGWVDRAWRDLQLQHNGRWMWMRKTVSFNTIAGQNEYIPTSAPISASDFSVWVSNTFRIYSNGDIQNQLDLNHWQSYEQFRSAYLLGSLQAQNSRPTDVTISPTKSLIFYPTPVDTSFTVTADYYKAPQTFTGELIPELPERFHEIIAYRALMYAATRESAGDLYQIAEREYKRMYSMLQLDQLPRMVITRGRYY